MHIKKAVNNNGARNVLSHKSCIKKKEVSLVSYLPFITKSFSFNFMSHTFFIKHTKLLFIINFNEFLAPSSRIRYIKLRTKGKKLIIIVSKYYISSIIIQLSGINGTHSTCILKKHTLGHSTC